MVKPIEAMKQDNDETQMGRLLMAAKAKYSSIKNFADIARHLHVDQQLLTDWKKRGIPSDKFDHLCEVFDCNFKWLKYHQGEMKNIPAIFQSKREKEIYQANEILRNLDESDFEKVKSVIEAFAQYSTSKKKKKTEGE